MKCAIIAPHDMLDLCSLVDEYHLVLPQETFRNPNYTRFYRDCKGYKILDNGEAEGFQVNPVDLAAIAEHVKADEIVVPDVIGDRAGTIQRVRDFERFVNPEMKYMGVIQGETIEELITMIYFYAEMPWITCIGIPRWTLGWNIMQRVTILTAIKQNYPDIWESKEWHCLGANSAWPHEVSVLATIEGLRGMDTSLPVVYGLAGRQLTTTGINRQVDFFDEKVDRSTMQWELIYDNVTEYLKLAGVDLTGGIDSLEGTDPSTPPTS